jgi:dUTP pyrophosphatase
MYGILCPKIMVTIPIKKLLESAKTPTRGSDFAAGYDLYATEAYTLKPLERKLFKTGITIAIPPNLYGRLAPRSGLAYKSGIDVMAGVIDSDYRSDIGIILINLGQSDFTVNVGDKIAQIIFETYNEATFADTDTLPLSVRGGGGFGSTDFTKSTVEGNVEAMKLIAKSFPETLSIRKSGLTVNVEASNEISHSKSQEMLDKHLVDVKKYEDAHRGKSLAELYLKDNGIIPKSRYADEVKARDQK